MLHLSHLSVLSLSLLEFTLQLSRFLHITGRLRFFDLFLQSLLVLLMGLSSIRHCLLDFLKLLLKLLHVSGAHLAGFHFLYHLLERFFRFVKVAFL